MRDFFGWLKSGDWVFGCVITASFAVVVAGVVFIGVFALTRLLAPADPSLTHLTPAIEVYHDVPRHVTCWTYNQYGISCLPDTR